MGCLRAVNFPCSSHLRKVGSLTPRRLAASLIVRISDEASPVLRGTGGDYRTLIKTVKGGYSRPPNAGADPG